MSTLSFCVSENYRYYRYEKRNNSISYENITLRHAMGSIDLQ